MRGGPAAAGKKGMMMMDYTNRMSEAQTIDASSQRLQVKMG